MEVHKAHAMKGNSGAELCFLEDLVIKAGDTRLKKSCELQRRFSSKFVKTPMVAFSEERHDRFCFGMDRIYGTSVFHKDVSYLRRVFSYVHWNLSVSRVCSLPSELFVDKIRSINCDYPEAQGLIDIFEYENVITLPCGPMHGDLTFCNIICDEDVWLIDFTDGFVSSPIFDIAKMRQDSYHGWIELFEDVPNRDVVDRHIAYEFPLPWVKEFTLLALLRIVPYARTPEVKAFLDKEIPRAYAHINSGR